MKQILFMIVMTAVGAGGAVLADPFWGVMVYDFFAVLRPQYLWEWSLPKDVAWSRYVAFATLASLLFHQPGRPSSLPGSQGDEGDGWALSTAHWCVLAFGVWVTLSYFFGKYRNEVWSDQVMIDYLKLFTMFVVSAWVVRTLRQVWTLFVMMTLVLIYISYEMNYLYLISGFLAIYRRGFGGLDNNGAALMLAMGVPMCVAVWDVVRRWYRWLILAMVPVIIHAVLMSYSRGAMLSLLVTCPLWLLRSRRRVQLGLIYVAVGLMIPVMAGKEIQARFFSVREHELDDSANQRKRAWAAAVEIANENPIFGAGLRGAALYSLRWSENEGRAIHSLYLQIAADNGWVGLGFYLATLGAGWLSARKVVRMLRGREDEEARQARAVACGLEGAMAVFCFGATFLSLETFELPWLLLFLAAQLPLVKGVHSPTVEQPAEVEEEVGALAVNGPA